jgi:hypothetical protein
MFDGDPESNIFCGLNLVKTLYHLHEKRTPAERQDEIVQCEQAIIDCLAGIFEELYAPYAADSISKRNTSKVSRKPVMVDADILLAEVRSVCEHRSQSQRRT